MKTKSYWADVVLGAKFGIGQEVRDNLNPNRDGVVVQIEIGENKVERSQPIATGDMFKATDLVYIVEWNGNKTDRSAFIEADGRLERR